MNTVLEKPHRLPPELLDMLNQCSERGIVTLEFDRIRELHGSRSDIRIAQMDWVPDRPETGRISWRWRSGCPFGR
jgi:hypothetical protein